MVLNLVLQVPGKIVKGSGFEDIVYQASLITSGSLLETILLAQFPADKSQKLPTELQGVASDPLSYSETVVHNNEEFFRSYGDYFQDTCK